MNLEKYVIGIEFGSTNIKAVLIDENHVPVASGSHGWENQLVDGIWTYSLDAIWNGLQDCYAKLKADAQEKLGVTITKVGAIGFSAMMHGYMAFDKDNKLLVPFRTWRNTITGQAAGELTKLFNYNIPQRWSISHLYQAILNGEAHVKDITFFTTLAGYIHWMLSGEKVLGVGDASGMFPIDPAVKNYIPEMIEKFDA
ncbi:MAG: ATPase, partial [Clostridia bacterium]|nr:ATPase [Clostridia bacterium]